MTPLLPHPLYPSIPTEPLCLNTTLLWSWSFGIKSHISSLWEISGSNLVLVVAVDGYPESSLRLFNRRCWNKHEIKLINDDQWSYKSTAHEAHALHSLQWWLLSGWKFLPSLSGLTYIAHSVLLVMGFALGWPKITHYRESWRLTL